MRLDFSAITNRNYIMKLKGLDYLDISSLFSEDEVMIQHSVREFVDNEVEKKQDAAITKYKRYLFIFKC